MFNYPLPAIQFTSLGYFYAETSGELGTFSKNANDQTLVIVDYSALLVGSITLTLPEFTISIGSNPPLSITNVQISGNLAMFITSQGAPGVSYSIGITETFSNGVINAQTLEVCVPTNLVTPVPSIPAVFNFGNPPSNYDAVFINYGVRYFVCDTPPSGANILDQWFNPLTRILSEYITDGQNLFWVANTQNIPIQPNLLYMEHLTVTQVNVLSDLTFSPNGGICVIVVNNDSFLLAPSFSTLGKRIIWSDSSYSINPGDDVNVFYTYTL